MFQNETFDAEMESLANNNKKNKKLPARHGHLEESIVRHKAHITRLEQMLRLLDNEVSSWSHMYCGCCSCQAFMQDASHQQQWQV